MAANMSIEDFIGQVKSSDKDFRYMAISDLERKLEGGIRPKDWTHNSAFMLAILSTLQDVHGDISAMGIKCLGLVVASDTKPKIDLLVRELGTHLLAGKKNNNTDVVSMALKAVIASAHGEACSAALAQDLIPTLLSAINNEEAEIQNAGLEVLQQLACRDSSIVQREHALLLTPLMSLLLTGKAAARKRSIQCLGVIGPHLPAETLLEVFSSCRSSLEDSNTPSAALTYIQLLASLSRSCGWRLSQQLQSAVPIIMGRSEEADEGEDELREGCLQALEAFIARPSPEMSCQVPEILTHALENLSYDPNYAEDMSLDGDDDDDEENEESEEEYSDDEDTSWKVRKAAARLLACIIGSYPNLLADVYSQATSILLARFKERDENVKLEIISTFTQLISQVAQSQDQGVPSTLLSSLRSDYPKIVKAACKQISHKSLKVKAGVLKVLGEMLIGGPTALAACAQEFTPGIISITKDASANNIPLRIQALEFLGSAFKDLPFSAWKRDSKELSEAVFAAAMDKYYRVAVAALVACQAFALAMRPQPASAAASPETKGLVSSLCKVIDARLAPHDQDQEVKEAAILCTAAAIASSADLMGPSYDHYIQVILERLKNDTTRLPAIKAFVQIAHSPLDLSIASIQQGLITELLSYLQKANRSLRQASLEALDAVLQNVAFSRSLPVGNIAESVSAVIHESDMLLTAIALHIGVVLLHSHPNAAKSVAHSILPPALQLAQSPILQATALTILKDFLVSLVNSNLPEVDAQAIQDQLLQAGSRRAASKACQLSCGKCIASLVKAAGEHQVSQTLQQLTAILQQRGSTTAQTSMALVAIGEIGRLVETSRHGNLFKTLLTAIETADEELKSAAAIALGATCSGQLSVYLPQLLQTIRLEESNPHQQYLLLQALHELLSSIQTHQLPPTFQEQAAKMLVENRSKEEDCRNVVAGCLGQLALLSPERLVPLMHHHSHQGGPWERVVMISALRMAVVDQPHPLDNQLSSILPQTLQSMSDSDWRVRKATVQLLGTLANHKIGLVRDMLPQLLPQLYKQTVVDDSLIKVVDLGPFKHTIDDGLDLRKASFDCMDFLLDTAPQALHFNDFLAYLQNGLVDAYDIKMPCHLLLAKVAASAGDQILQSLDNLVPALQSTLSVKLRQEAVKQEVERNDDMVRSCLRAIEACSRIPNIESCPAFQNLLKKQVLQPPLDAKFKAVASERAELDGRSSKAG